VIFLPPSHKLVNDAGPSDAKIMLVGEAPGEVEERTGIPFTNEEGAGRILNGALTQAGLKRSDCYITNVMNYRPPQNNFDTFYKDTKKRKDPTDALLEGRRVLLDKVISLQPNLVVALGDEALKALTFDKGILNHRGYLKLSKEGSRKVLPTIHPAFVIRQFSYFALLVMDLIKAKEESLFPDYILKDRLLITSPTLDQVKVALQNCRDSKRVAFDIETVGSRLISCIGFAWSDQAAISIPFIYKGNGSYWSPTEETIIFKEIKSVLLDKSIEKILQNAQFDLSWIISKWGYCPAPLRMDTMLAFHTLYSEFQKSLKLLASIYTDIPYYKEAGLTNESLWRYNATDAIVTFECAEKIEKELKEEKMWSFYLRQMNAMLLPTIDMQINGVRIDVQARNILDMELHQKKIELQKQLDLLAGAGFNANSNKQCKELFYDKLKLPPLRSKDTNALKCDEEALQSWKKTSPQLNSLFDTVLSYRGTIKTLTTYVEAPLSEDNRIHTSYLIDGTSTGRLSSREAWDGTGTNLQNIPKELRHLFIPNEGKVFIELDLSQAETRIVAYLSQDPTMMAVFETGKDIHTYTASRIYHKPEAEVSKEERYKAKCSNHGFDYGMGPIVFARQHSLTGAEAAFLMSEHFKTFPMVKVWQSEIRRQLWATRVVSTPLGRIRRFYGRLNDETHRSALSFIPQATVSDILCQGMLGMWMVLPRGSLVLQVHDSVLVQCKTEEVEDFIRIMKNCLDIPITIHQRTFKIPVDIKVGETWGTLKEKKDESVCT
jgi:DNA polymerase-1